MRSYQFDRILFAKYRVSFVKIIIRHVTILAYIIQCWIWSNANYLDYSSIAVLYVVCHACEVPTFREFTYFPATCFII